MTHREWRTGNRFIVELDVNLVVTRFGWCILIGHCLPTSCLLLQRKFVSIWWSDSNVEFGPLRNPRSTNEEICFFFGWSSSNSRTYSFQCRGQALSWGSGMTELGQVSHSGQLVEITIGKFICRNCLADTQLRLSSIHRLNTVLVAIVSSHCLTVWELSLGHGISQGTKRQAVHPVGGEVGDGLVGDLAVDPVQQRMVAAWVWSTESGDVRHHRQLVWLLHGKILGVHDLGNIEFLLGDVHGFGDVLQSVVGIKGCMIRNETRLAGVNKSREIASIVPVGGKVGHLVAGNGSVDESKKQLFCVESFLFCFLALFWVVWTTNTSNLVAKDESPQQTKNQLCVALINILST